MTGGRTDPGAVHAAAARRVPLELAVSQRLHHVLRPQRGPALAQSDTERVCVCMCV